MVYIPDIVNYQPFYIQTDADETAIDTTSWGLVAKANPFPALPIPKEPYKNEWLDEDGDDEYNSHMTYESFEFDVLFYVKAFDSSAGSGEEIIRKQVDEFFAKIREGEFSIFDSYTGLGRRKVRYAGFSEDGFKRGRNWARAIFSITFKVNDPVTRMVMSSGKIIAE